MIVYIDSKHARAGQNIHVWWTWRQAEQRPVGGKWTKSMMMEQVQCRSYNSSRHCPLTYARVGCRLLFLKLDLESREWTQVRADGMRPTARLYHTMTSESRPHRDSSKRIWNSFNWQLQLIMSISLDLCSSSASPGR
jgi:hypothetical protein